MWKATYKLRKMYPGVTTLGLLVNDEGYTQEGMRVIDFPRGWPEYWDRL